MYKLIFLSSELLIMRIKCCNNFTDNEIRQFIYTLFIICIYFVSVGMIATFITNTAYVCIGIMAVTLIPCLWSGTYFTRVYPVKELVEEYEKYDNLNNKLEIKSYILKNNTILPSGSTCDICDETIKIIDKFCKSPSCSHYFHLNCFEKKQKESFNCPFCTKTINKLEIYKYKFKKKTNNKIQNVERDIELSEKYETI